MTLTTRMNLLRWALIIIGVILIVGIMPLMSLWPSGWQWVPNQYEYEQMIMGIYATLGVFLILAAKNPLEHKSLIWFTVWSSLVHASIMGIQVIVDKRELGHLLGDVPALFIIAIVLAYLMPKGNTKLDQTK